MSITIDSLSSTIGVVGKTIEIYGNGFDPFGSSVVKFNGVQAVVTDCHPITGPLGNSASNQLTCTVPAGATTGAVTVDTATGPIFTVESFYISNVYVKYDNMIPGAPIEIQGEGFSPVSSNNIVKINNVSVPISSCKADGTGITVYLPTNLISGSATISVTIGTITKTKTITIMPSVTGLTPTFGYAGTSLTIKGNGFGSTNIVKFDAIQAVVTSSDNKSITCIVPSGINTFKCGVLVNSNGVTQSMNWDTTNNRSFILNFNPAPVIESLNPNSGAPGSSFVINGYGPSAYYSTISLNTVKLNGVNLEILSSINSGQYLKCVLPTGATTGSVTVTLNGLISNGVTFTVVPNTVTLSTTNAPTGSSVTLTINNGTIESLTSAQVKFNGVLATNVSYTSKSITVTVPMSATSGPVTLTTNVSKYGIYPSQNFTVAPSYVVTKILNLVNGATVSSIYYSKNGGTTWTSWTTSTLSFNSNDNMSFKALFTRKAGTTDTVFGAITALGTPTSHHIESTGSASTNIVLPAFKASCNYQIEFYSESVKPTGTRT